MLEPLFNFVKSLFHIPNRIELILTLDKSGLSETQLKALRKCIYLLHLDEKNLTKTNLFEVLFALGHNPSDDVIDFHLRLFKLNRRTSFTIDQLAHIWNSILSNNVDEEEILRQAFEFFDLDGNGELSMAELKATMADMGNLLTEQEIEEFMGIMDVNNDGAVDYHEFLDMLRSQINIVDLMEEGIINDGTETSTNVTPRPANVEVEANGSEVSPQKSPTEPLRATASITVAGNIRHEILQALRNNPSVTAGLGLQTPGSGHSNAVSFGHNNATDKDEVVSLLATHPTPVVDIPSDKSFRPFTNNMRSTHGNGGVPRRGSFFASPLSFTAAQGTQGSDIDLATCASVPLAPVVGLGSNGGGGVPTKQAVSGRASGNVDAPSRVEERRGRSTGSLDGGGMQDGVL